MALNHLIFPRILQQQKQKHRGGNLLEYSRIFSIIPEDSFLFWYFFLKVKKPVSSFISFSLFSKKGNFFNFFKKGAAGGGNRG